MPGEPKRIIVLASVLKPVDDTRLYEKIGLTLAREAHHEIHIIGFPSASPSTQGAIHQHPLKPFARLSVARVLAPFRILKKMWTLRPSLVIIATHELLCAALVMKLFRGSRIVYDVQENYFRNILYTGAFPKIMRPLVAGYVRLKEMVTANFVNHFLLAEKSYAQEISFFGNRKTILENKARRPNALPTRSPVKLKQDVVLIFTGTLAESTGVFTAIDLAISLHRADNRIKLVIAGYAAQPPVLEKIKLAIQPHAFITLQGGSTLVPHTEILELVARADFGIIAYPENLSTINATPTKLYEYLAYQLPILLIHHPRWASLCEPYPAAITFHPDRLHTSALLEAMNETAFYRTAPNQAFWETQETLVLDLVAREIKR